MSRCEQGYHLWDYDSTTNPDDAFPFPTFNYSCAFRCDTILPVEGLFSMDECPHDAGWTLDPCVGSDASVVMCMRCGWAPDPDSDLNKEQIRLYFARLFWCGPVCPDHGDVPWPVTLGE